MFSENAKTEILNAPLRSRKTKLAFFGAYARTAGEFVLSNGEKRFIVRCESSAIKERLIQILIESYSLNAGYVEDKKLIVIRYHNGAILFCVWKNVVYKQHNCFFPLTNFMVKTSKRIIDFMPQPHDIGVMWI